jgi:hypothetical protein
MANRLTNDVAPKASASSMNLTNPHPYTVGKPLLVLLWCALQVTASVPWPMTGTVEAVMADQAKKTVGQYVHWIGKYVEAALEDINNLQQQAAGEGGLVQLHVTGNAG